MKIILSHTYAFYFFQTVNQEQPLYNFLAFLETQNQKKAQLTTQPRLYPQQHPFLFNPHTVFLDTQASREQHHAYSITYFFFSGFGLGLLSCWILLIFTYLQTSQSASTRPPLKLLQLKNPQHKIDFDVDQARQPELIDDLNVSAVYLLKDKQGRPICVFKPQASALAAEEECQHDKRLSTHREVNNEACAYEINSNLFTNNTFPKTTLFSFNNRQGSAQEYIPNTESCADYGPAKFNTLDLHKIAVIDLRILNLDRHAGNMLINTAQNRVYPIDHALSFPTKKDLKDVTLDWTSYKLQLSAEVSEEIKEGIRNINWKQDVEICEKYGLSKEQIALSLCSSRLLQKGVLEEGRSLLEIGEIVQRSGAGESPSEFEKMIEKIDLTASYEEIWKQMGEVNV